MSYSLRKGFFALTRYGPCVKIYTGNQLFERGFDGEKNGKRYGDRGNRCGDGAGLCGGSPPADHRYGDHAWRDGDLAEGGAHGRSIGNQCAGI